ncbi:2-isopropylmalate synthase [Alkalibacter saccharofermentans]|uniref:Isopropylmalate/homocitrate/citramalate synthases n=1 Tax=Alkalibacter saccharofermentans DSM 14828 TaxID=1120975 RepID=A0A1M4YAR8_9FIRM|nr:2-isopropylmalate synthase [Alkalibacter saccharofermentans]SHF02891.1 Isopropylmalate/homocitrate/citramalate synthases [Alkalibacter saccharofermentans DSM 14828]
MIEKKIYEFNAVDVDEPNLYENYFPYTEIPKIKFNGKTIDMDIPEEIWITDTTFRDGQQSMSAFTVEQISRLFDYLHQIDNGTGLIRTSEFFLYSEKDRQAVYKCMEKGYDFPKITSWIRANANDFELVKSMGIKETGLLMSCSDYHIFKKLKLNRSSCMEKYLGIIKQALEQGILPRCHLEDITRADFYGFVLPLIKNIQELGKEAGVQIKIRLCDTLGLGVPYQGVDLPRSIPEMIQEIKNQGGVPSEALEWHGHNDYHNVVTNATTAWLYGAAAVNTTIFGIGERTGNCPLEGMLVEYCQLKDDKKINLTMINELRDFFENEFNYFIDVKRPFVGDDFNMTKAGVHADGIMKYEAIYNSFDTKKILNRPVVIKVNQASGLAGIAAWINNYCSFVEDDKVGKKDPLVLKIKTWVDEQYERGRTTSISDEELAAFLGRHK